MEWKFLSPAVPLLLFLTVAFHGCSVAANDGTCSAYVYPGIADVDLKIGVILGMHRSKDGQCDSTYLDGGVQQAIALNWATELLNGNNVTASFIPGVRLGVDVYDDCYTEYLAARHAGAVAAHAEGISECYVSHNSAHSAIPVAGMIGTSLSKTTTIVADIVQPTNVPLVGISATLPELSDKSRYPGFIRTVPSDLKQAQVIIALAKYYSWSYIVGLHTADNYGTQGMAKIRELADRERICISVTETFSAVNEVPENQLEDFVRETLVKKIVDMQASIGVVYFGQNSRLVALLEFMEQKRHLWGITNELAKIYWIVSDAVVADRKLAGLIKEYGTKMLVVGPPWSPLVSFEDYFFRVLESPPAWLVGPWRTAIADIMKNKFGCVGYDFSKESVQRCNNLRSSVRFSRYLNAAVDAVYLLANSLKIVHSSACQGAPGMCSTFTTSINQGLLTIGQMNDLNYTAIPPVYVPKEFVDSGRYLKEALGDFEAVNQSLYSIQANVANDNNDFRPIGNFKGNTVSIDPPYKSILHQSQCPKTCTECLDIDKINHLFRPGKHIILGMFSIHWQSGETTNAYECGAYRDESASYVAMLAFMNSIEQLRNITGEEEGVGYLVLDDCYNPLTATRMLNKVLSGDLPIFSSDGQTQFQPSKVTVAIGAQSSPVTMASLPILKDLGIPLISYSSTNPTLDNDISYPYFSRTVSSDSVQAVAILRMVKELGVTYVGAFAIGNSYGLELYRQFRSKAEAVGICVDDVFEMSRETTVDQVRTKLHTYRERTIKVVVAFVMDTIASTILNAVTQEDTFVFIASEAWGPNQDIIDGVKGERARGSLVFGAFRPPQLNYGFRDYLQTLDPYDGSSDGWLREFWQDHFDCNLPGGFNNEHERFCLHQTSPGYFSEAELKELVNSPLAVHSTLATLSAGLAVESLLQKGRMPFDPRQLTSAIRNVELVANGGPYRPFADSGSGSGGFQIYNVQLENNEYVYQEVGVAKNNGEVDMDKSQLKFYDVTGGIVDHVTSSCKLRTECKVCGDSRPTPSPPSNGSGQGGSGEEGESDSSLMAAVIALAVLLGLLLLVVILVLFCMYRRKTGLFPYKSDTDEVRYTTTSSSVSMHRLRTGSYPANGMSVSAGSERPPLPAPRPRPDDSNYKAQSDILKAAPPGSEQLADRPRSMSMPVVGDDDSEPFEPLRLPTCVASPLQPPRPHVPMSQVSNTSQMSSSSGASHHTDHNNQPTLVKGVRQSPGLPVFYLRDTERGPVRDPHSSSGSSDVSASDISRIYGEKYRNEPNQSQHAMQSPPEPIRFLNVTSGNDAYSLSLPINPNPNPIYTSSNQNPAIVYSPNSVNELLAAHLAQYIAAQYPGQLQNHPAHSQNYPGQLLLNPANLLPQNNNPNVATMNTAGSESSRSPGSPGDGSSFPGTREAPSPAQCNPAGDTGVYITPINVVYAGSGQGQSSPVGGANLQQPFPVYGGQAAPGAPSQTVMPAAALAHPQAISVGSSSVPVRRDNTLTVSSVDYPQTQNVQQQPPWGAVGHQEVPAEQVLPQNILAPTDQTLQQQPVNGLMRHPGVIPPGSLPLTSQYYSGNQLRPGQNLFQLNQNGLPVVNKSQGYNVPTADGHQLSPESPPVQPPGTSQPNDLNKLPADLPNSHQVQKNSDKITSVTRWPRNHHSPIRMGRRPLYSDILEESGEFTAEV